MTHKAIHDLLDDALFARPWQIDGFDVTRIDIRPQGVDAIEQLELSVEGQRPYLIKGHASLMTDEDAGTMVGWVHDFVRGRQAYLSVNAPEGVREVTSVAPPGLPPVVTTSPHAEGVADPVEEESGGLGSASPGALVFGDSIYSGGHVGHKRLTQAQVKEDDGEQGPASPGALVFGDAIYSGMSGRDERQAQAPADEDFVARGLVSPGALVFGDAIYSGAPAQSSQDTPVQDRIESEPQAPDSWLARILANVNPEDWVQRGPDPSELGHGVHGDGPGTDVLAGEVEAVPQMSADRPEMMIALDEMAKSVPGNESAGASEEKPAGFSVQDLIGAAGQREERAIEETRSVDTDWAIDKQADNQTDLRTEGTLDVGESEGGQDLVQGRDRAEDTEREPIAQAVNSGKATTRARRARKPMAEETFQRLMMTWIFVFAPLCAAAMVNLCTATEAEPFGRQPILNWLTLGMIALGYVLMWISPPDPTLAKRAAQDS